MEEIMIRASDFSEARNLLAKRFHKTGIPIRIGESNVFRFVDLCNIEMKQVDIDYTKGTKKQRKFSY